jgi:hemerythrin superfamily protein
VRRWFGGNINSGSEFLVDAISLLRSDHKNVEQLFKRYERAGERAHAEKREVVDRIIEALSVHAAIEEQIFYPVARETVPATDDIVLESLEEHHIVKWVLSELDGLDPADERFDAKVTVLIENVRHHVEEEEREFFPKVRDALGRAALSDLGEALAAAKKSAPTKPHPRMPDAAPANVVVGAVTGVVDRVGENVSGIAQGGVNAVQDLVARIIRTAKPKKSSDAAKQTARRTTSGAASAAKKTASSAKRTAKRSATATKKSAGATKSVAKRSAAQTGRATKSQAKQTATRRRQAAATQRSRTKAAA